mgnify:CR=1 FL=1
MHYNQNSDVIYYEVLDLPLPELEQLKTLKVAFHNSKTAEVSSHNIRLPKESCVTDVLSELCRQLGPDVTITRPLRLLEVFYHKIYKVFPPNEKIDSINDQYWTLRAEEIPDEDTELDKNERLIHVYHFTNDGGANHVVQNFGEPFLLKVRDDETLASVRRRIQAKLEVSETQIHP